MGKNSGPQGLAHLEVSARHHRPLPMEVAAWAGHPAAAWFLSELDRLLLDSLCRLEAVPPNSWEVSREQGFCRGLRAAMARLEELRPKRKRSEDGEDDDE